MNAQAETVGEVTEATRAGRCFLCGRAPERVVWREHGYGAAACACGLRFVQPAPQPGSIDPLADPHDDAFYRLPATYKARWVRRHAPGRTLLDVGCGDGHFLVAARAAGWDVTGLEPHRDRAARARARGLRVLPRSLEQMEAQPERWDVVYHCDLLSHFEEPIEALRRMRALLAPGGALCFEAGLLGGISPRWYALIGDIGLPQHRFLYTHDALARLCARAGLAIEQVRHHGLAPSVMLAAGTRLVAQMVRCARGLDRGASGTEERARPPRPLWRRLLHAAYERAGYIARYPVGAIAPDVGPATLLVLARPAAYTGERLRGAR